jgi:hypothetical protein
MTTATATTAEQLLPLVTRLQGHKIGCIDGSDVFAIQSGWPAEQLRMERGVTTASTPMELETAMQDDRVSTIFVPRDTFGWATLEKILLRNSLVKTIYWEE